MMLALALLALAQAPASSGAPPEGAAAPPAVIVLPLLADGTVSLKQAEGVTAQVRRAISDDVAKLLTSTGEDRKASEQCARDAACLGRLADLRGADLVGAGLVSPAPDGLKVQLVVVAPGATTATRRVDITLQGNDADERRLARLVRSAFHPDALRGGVLVTGPEGARVTVDGADAGTLPMAAPVTNLREGDHIVVVTKDGDGEFRRSVGVVHGDTTEVRAVLVDSADAPVPTAKSDDGIGTDVIVVGSIGAGLVVLGGVAGTLSLLDGLTVESRAAAQNLAFPTDADVMARGNILAWTANGLYAGALLAFGAAAALYALDVPPPSEAASAGSAR